jgi:hypothetical protein
MEDGNQEMGHEEGEKGIWPAKRMRMPDEMTEASDLNWNWN